ncbi:TPA: aminopeptidase P family protein [Streptococcus suis]|nr:aminopeptidase P family protein [Streptococcus suis]HEM3721585.1 aminopeptidase P family protein [Streptococcus suis]
MQQRLEKLRGKMAEQSIEALYVTNLKNVYYLTGFWGSSGAVLITPNRQVLITDDRYITYAQSVVKDFEVISNRDDLGTAAGLVKDMGIKEVAFEDEISVAYFKSMEAVFIGIALRPTTNLIADLRMIKDAAEVTTIQRACQISDQAFIDALDFIKPGKTEIEVANFLDFRMREMGAEGVSFDTIAASGYRSAMPHGRASNKVIEAGEALTLDFGCLYDHYVSDMTRTIHIGHVTDQEREIYDVVLRANKALIEQAKEGVTYREFDAIPREIINAAGYGANFTHGIGHGIGLDIHEYPYFGKSDETIKAGMVLTDEPGIYLDDKYGVRIEDDLLITENGCEVLTLAPKELIVI